MNKKKKEDDLESESLKIDPTLPDDLEKDVKEEDEPREEDAEPTEENDISSQDEEEHQENKYYMEDQFVNLDDLIKEKKKNDED